MKSWKYMSWVFVLFLLFTNVLSAKNSSEYNISIIYPPNQTIANRYKQQIDLLNQDSKIDPFTLIFQNKKSESVIIGIKYFDVIQGNNSFMTYESTNSCGIQTPNENILIEANSDAAITFTINNTKLDKMVDHNCAIGLSIVDYDEFVEENLDLKEEVVSEYVNINIHQSLDKSPLQLVLESFEYKDEKFVANFSNESNTYYDLVNYNINIMDENNQEIAIMEILEGRIYPFSSFPIEIKPNKNLKPGTYELNMGVYSNGELQSISQKITIDKENLIVKQEKSGFEWGLIIVAIFFILAALLHILRVKRFKKNINRRKEFRKVNYIK